MDNKYDKRVITFHSFPKKTQDAALNIILINCHFTELW